MACACDSALICYVQNELSHWNLQEFKHLDEFERQFIALKESVIRSAKLADLGSVKSPADARPWLLTVEFRHPLDEEPKHTDLDISFHAVGEPVIHRLHFDAGALQGLEALMSLRLSGNYFSTTPASSWAFRSARTDRPRSHCRFAVFRCCG